MDRNASNIRVLVIDDDDSVRNFTTKALTRAGFITSSANGGVEGIKSLESQTYDVVVCDLAMPDKDGLEVLRHAARVNPRPVFIVVTGFGSITVAVEAMKRGASDFVEKPVSIDTLRAVILAALDRAKAAEAPKKDKLLAKGLIGSPEWLEPFLDQLRRIAARDSTVLILGETGTGKSAVAREIWRQSQRAKGPFVEMNCAAIPEALMESELFGHKKGAFTGASADYAGRVEQANCGTLFLDEVGELKMELQSKLLQVLQEKTFTPVGGSKQQAADVRFIAATNKNLEAEVEANRFRSDLYYRLNVVDLTVPPLRGRTADIPLLVEHFQSVLADREPNEAQPIFSPETLQMMMRYPWRGNIRELENFVERMAVKHPAGEVIHPSDLPDRMRDDLGTHAAPSERGMTIPPAPLMRVVNPLETPRPEAASLGTAVQGYEKEIILRALTKHKWNKSAASRELQMKRTTLLERIKKLGVVEPPAGDVDDPASEE